MRHIFLLCIGFALSAGVDILIGSFLVEQTLAGLFALAVFITSHKEKDELYERKASELYRFAEFGRLSSGIFHDLMNPLTTISLAIEKLQEREVDPDTGAVEQIQRAVRASKRMESFMHTARKQLRCDDYNCLFPIKREIDEAVSLLEYKTRVSRIGIKTDISESHRIYGNPVRFFQIIVNLASNAIDSYQLTQPELLTQCKVVISAERKGNELEISVRDTGCGIPRHMQSAIFRPFFTTKLGCDGVGLGLSMTRHIIEHDFKGTISVESVCGIGSLFTVCVPLPQEDIIGSK
jgi:signal transduction histidine kinase